MVSASYKLHEIQHNNIIDNGKPSEKMGRKAIGPVMDCKAAEVLKGMAYTIIGMGFFITESNNKWKKDVSKGLKPT